MNPGKIEKLEQTGPNPDIIRLTEKIIDQNKTIIEMNAKLLALLSNPVLIISDERILEEYKNPHPCHGVKQ